MINSVIKHAAVVDDDDWGREKNKEKEWEEQWLKMCLKFIERTRRNYVPNPFNFLWKSFSIRADKTYTALGGATSSEAHIMVKGPNTLCKVTCDKLEDIAYRRWDQDFFKDHNSHDSFARICSSVDVSCEGLRLFWHEQRPFLNWLDERYKAPGEEKAIKYLTDIMKRNRFPRHKETIQTAITALKYLLAEDLKADEIKVYVFGRDRWIDGVLPVEEIEKHLTDINNQSESVNFE